MLSTLLLILKILGMVILVVLGLVLTALLLVLLVPVRYRFWCSYEEDAKAKVKVIWLLHLVSVLATYDKSLNLSIRLLGFPLGGSKKKDAECEEDETAGEPMDNRLPGEDDGSEEWQMTGWDEAGGGDDDTGGGYPADSREAGDTGGRYLADNQETGDTEERYLVDGREAGDTKAKYPVDSHPEEEEKANGRQADKSSAGTEHEKEKKIRGKKWKPFSPGKILRKIKFRFQAVCDKVKAVKEKGRKLDKFLTEPANQKSFGHIMKILKHILPRKMKGSLEFGLADPATTGYVTALCSLAYARYGDSLEITPVFDEQVLKARVEGKGRIFLGVILFWSARILMNKNFRDLIFKRGRKKDGGEENGRE